MKTPQQIWDEFVVIPQQDMKEYLPFLRAIAGGRVLEIGVCAGVSTSAFLLGMDDKRDGHLFSIDIKQECGTILSHPRWTFIQGDSLTMPIPEEPESFDVLLIDGEHDYESVASDLRRFSPLVKRGGLILNHDLLPPGYEESRRAWDEFRKAHSIWPATILPGLFGLGVIAKL